MASTFLILFFSCVTFFVSPFCTAMGPPSPTPIPSFGPTTPLAPLVAGFSPGPVQLGTPAPIHLYTPKPFTGQPPALAPAPHPSLAPHLIQTPAVPDLGPTPEPLLPHLPPLPSPTPVPLHPLKDYGICNPLAAPFCANLTGLHYCLEDPDYPEYDIKMAISHDRLFDKKFTDVADQSANDLVESIPASQEELLDYTYYSGASKGRSPFDISHWTGPEGFLCPSHVAYAMPKRARNVNGEWRVIVNGVAHFTQTARIESCLFPDSACRLLAPCYQSKCTQKYVYHRMLAFDPCDPYKGIFVDVFKFASACSCHVSQH